MSNRAILLLFVVLTLSSGVAVAAVAAAAGKTHHDTVWSASCVPELTAATTTNCKALGRDAVHGGLISHECEAGHGVALPARNSREGGVPGVPEGATEAEPRPSPRDFHGRARHPPRAYSRSVARRSSGLNDDDSMVNMKPTSTSIRESAQGDTLPRGRGRGDHPLNIIGDSWRAHPSDVDGGDVVSVPFVLAVDALHLPMVKHVPTKKSFNRYFPTLLPASGMFAAAAAAGEPEHTADAVFIALVVVTTVQLSRHDQKKKKKKTRRGRTRAAAALLVLLAAVAALPIGAAAAGVMPKSLASSGRSPCTNDPNTMDAGRPCVHP